MRKAIGFDLDGTLFDDRQYVRQGLDAAAAYLHEATGRDLRAAFYETYFERGRRTRTFDVVCAEHDVDPSHVPHLVDAYHAADGPLQPEPGAESVLSTLQRRFQLGVLTGGRNGRSKLERLGLDRYVDTVVVAPERGRSKRDRETFEWFYEELGVSPDESVYVGDRPELDLAWPAELGALTVLVRGSHWESRSGPRTPEPTLEIDRLAALPEALESIGVSSTGGGE